MSEKTFEPAEWPFAEKMVKFINETDAKLVELEAALKLYREQTVAALKEMGFDFDKVKVRARVSQTDKPNAVDNARHLGPSADPVDWSAEPNLDDKK